MSLKQLFATIRLKKVQVKWFLYNQILSDKEMKPDPVPRNVHLAKEKGQLANLANRTSLTSIVS
jgi:hypothetical protein